MLRAMKCSWLVLNILAGLPYKKSIDSLMHESPVASQGILTANTCGCWNTRTVTAAYCLQSLFSCLFFLFSVDSCQAWCNPIKILVVYDQPPLTPGQVIPWGSSHLVHCGIACWTTRCIALQCVLCVCNVFEMAAQCTYKQPLCYYLIQCVLQCGEGF